MKAPSLADLRRRLPSVASLLQEPAVEHLCRLYGRDQVVVQVRRTLDELRQWLGEASPEAEADAELERRVEALPETLAADLEEELGGMRRILNATGIFLHTNLGRAPLPRQVARQLPGLLDAYCDLELDLETGKRGERNRRVARLLCRLTGAEAAVVTNNNAAAVALALRSLAEGRQVVVSRGELVEIGGSFRLPEIMRASGVELVEVGSTNRTRLSDYAEAIGQETALLLKVFPSNFRMSGFVAAVAPVELAELGHKAGVPVLVDEGSGLVRPHPAPQLDDHPSLAQLVGAGCDLACGSGDKVLGGPQAGLLVGRQRLVELCQRHPLYRTWRPNRATYAALESVLRRRLAGDPLPLDRLWPGPDDHRRRLERMAASLGAEIVTANAFVGGGSAPEMPIPGQVLALPEDQDLLRRLRLGSPPVVAYIRDRRLILDLRTVDPEDDPVLLEAVRQARGS